MEPHPEITKERVKQFEKWKNISDEVAEQIVWTVKRLTEIFYVSISRELSLNPIPLPEPKKQNTS